MTVLSEEVKRRIVVELASFRTTIEVSEILVRDHGIEMQAKDLCRYDASKDYFVGGTALFDLFRETRSRFIHEVADIAIASQGYRLRRLQRMSEEAEGSGNFRVAAALLQQAAKEIGGLYARARRADSDREWITEKEATRRYAVYREEHDRRKAEQQANPRPAVRMTTAAEVRERFRLRLEEERREAERQAYCDSFYLARRAAKDAAPDAGASIPAGPSGPETAKAPEGAGGTVAPAAAESDWEAEQSLRDRAAGIDLDDESGDAAGDARPVADPAGAGDGKATRPRRSGAECVTASPATVPPGYSGLAESDRARRLANERFMAVR